MTDYETGYHDGESSMSADWDRALNDSKLADEPGLTEVGEWWPIATARAIDALIAQRDRARDIAVSLEQELAEVQRLAKTVDGLRNVFGVKS